MAAPKREQFANNAVDALDGAIDDTVTTLDVTDASAFPTDGNFRILIDSEIMLVTAVSTNTFTVVRGQEGTTAAAHVNGATVTHLVTQASLGRLVRDSVLYGHESNRPPMGIFDENGDAIDSSAFTWVNESLGAVVDHDGFMSITVSSGAGTHFLRGLFRSVPGSTPWSVIACLQGMIIRNLVDNSPGSWGIGVRESSTGKMTTFLVDTKVAVQNWTDETNMSGDASLNQVLTAASTLWLKIQDDGTDLNFSISTNGIDWNEVYSSSRTAHMAGGPDQAGIIANRHNNSAKKIFLDVLHWSYGD